MQPLNRLKSSWSCPTDLRPQLRLWLRVAHANVKRTRTAWVTHTESMPGGSAHHRRKPRTTMRTAHAHAAGHKCIPAKSDRSGHTRLLAVYSARKLPSRLPEVVQQPLRKHRQLIATRIVTRQIRCPFAVLFGDCRISGQLS